MKENKIIHFFNSLFLAFGSMLSLDPSRDEREIHIVSTNKLSVASHFEAAGKYIGEATNTVKQES